MDRQFKHDLLPKTNHDELARQNFVQSLELYLQKTMTPSVKDIYETRVKPHFEQQHQHQTQDRHEIRNQMEHQSYYRWFGAIKRTTQEMLWDSVITSVERQLPELIARMQAIGNPIGSLTLNPDLPIPAYQTAVDIHCMPGGYCKEFQVEDISGAAVYDRGTYLYGRGWLGSLNDDLGQSAIHGFLKQQYPDLQPKKILDLGCAVGHSTLPYVDAYPEAEVYAIDLAAPMLRYAHARAEVLGKRVHFVQDNAEQTRFASESFDLVVSHILFHEIPVPAIRNVMKECYRLLAPGGIMVHLEAPLYRHMDAYTAFMYDWQTTNNNEPYWSAMRELDLAAVAQEAGFAQKQLVETFAASYLWSQPNPEGQRYGVGSRGTWYVLAATKS